LERYSSQVRDGLQQGQRSKGEKQKKTPREKKKDALELDIEKEPPVTSSLPPSYMPSFLVGSCSSCSSSSDIFNSKVTNKGSETMQIIVPATAGEDNPTNHIH
jgi:hypothetical protein